MVDSARKELECPICMEVMMPPARIWQCKVACLICLQLTLFVISADKYDMKRYAVHYDIAE